MAEAYNVVSFRNDRENQADPYISYNQGLVIVPRETFTILPGQNIQIVTSVYTRSTDEKYSLESVSSNAVVKNVPFDSSLYKTCWFEWVLYSYIYPYIGIDNSHPITLSITNTSDVDVVFERDSPICRIIPNSDVSPCVYL